jgi:hypothetical protein
MMNKLFWVILLIVIAALTVLAVTNHKVASNNSTNSTNSTNITQTQVEDKWVFLAKALTAKGAKLYGASWCGHCKEQKEMFGTAFQYVTYVECADPKDPNRQTQACVNAKIEGYPTWTFADGSQEEGTQSYEALVQKVGL